MKFIYLLFIQTILLVSCINKGEILENHIQNLRDARVKKFTVTECLTDCYLDTGRLINQSLDSNILKLELSHWMNCATSTNNDIARFEYKNGILNLLVKSIPVDFDIEENGDTNYVYEGEACDCYFIFNYELTGFKEIPDSILINHKPINNYLGMMIGLNLIEKVDSQDSVN